MNEGLFGAATGQEPSMFNGPPKKRGVLDALSFLFTGGDDVRLSGEQNAQGRKAAMLRAGLATILSGSQNPNALAALATGAIAGQQTRAKYNESVVETQEQQALAQLAQSGELTPAILKKAFQHAVATGNANLANAVVGMMGNMSEPDQGGVQIAGPGNTVLDKKGNVIRTIPAAEPTAKAPIYGTPEYFAAREKELELQSKYRVSGGGRGQPRAYVDEATGEQRMGVYNPDTGEFDPVEGAAPVVAASEKERSAAGFLQMIPRHMEFIDSLENAPGRVEQALSDKGIREFTSEEMQKRRLAAIVIGEAWLRTTTGAAYNILEYENAGYAFLPAPGDKKGTLEYKKLMRDDLKALLTTTAGRAAAGALRGRTPVAGAASGVNPFAGGPPKPGLAPVKR